MPGERNLDTLSAHPARRRYTKTNSCFARSREIAGDPVCAFREAEGWTLVLRRAEAERLGHPVHLPLPP